jgi:hypothetical protein
LPNAAELPAQTEIAMRAAGFEVRPSPSRPLPGAIRHVVLVVKGTRSYDEILGDIPRVSSGPVMGEPSIARFGSDGYAGGLGKRLSLHHINLTPNHHSLAARWSFSDNFYTESGDSSEGLQFFAPWKHLLRNGVSFASFGDNFDPDVSDVVRVGRVIQEIGERYERGREFPQFVLIRLPNDRLAVPRPEAGFLYSESYVADNDSALGRLVEYLSGTRWWGSMAVFVTEASTDSSIDHIDPHRTVFLCLGPWARRSFVSHTNASPPGLLKTIFRLLGVPPLTLHDAVAADLSDCFAPTADPSPYHALPEDPRLFSSP